MDWDRPIGLQPSAWRPPFLRQTQVMHRTMYVERELRR